MYNLTFKTLAEACKLNNVTEADMVVELRAHLKNKNYRADYNKGKNELVKAAKSDPRFKALMAELKAAKKVG